MIKNTPWRYWTALLLICSTQLHAAIFTVTRTNISGPGSFPVVLNQANATPGDHVIEFSIPGTIVLTTSLPVITNNITINGRGTNETIISGGGSVSLLTFASGTTCFVSRVTLTGAFRTGDGGAISNAGCLFLSDCSLFGNAAGKLGGAIYNQGNLTIKTVLLKQNSATNGGAIYNLGTLDIRDSAIETNNATGGNGGAVDNSGTLSVFGTQIVGNTTRTNGFGGAVNNQSAATFTNCVVRGNTGGIGGGVYNRGTLSVNSTTIAANSAGIGGGICSTGFVNMASSIVYSNATYYGLGGGIYAGGQLSINQSSLYDNKATGGDGTPASQGSGRGGGGGGGALGGGLYATNCITTITNSTFSRNSANGGNAFRFYEPNGIGGGMFGGKWGETGGFASGGGGGSAAMGGSGGFAGGGGGGGWNSYDGGPGGQFGGTGGRAVSSNNGGLGGGGAGLGGGIFLYGGELIAVNCTLATNNSVGGSGFQSGSGLGGGVFNYNGKTTIHNTIVAGNSAVNESLDLWGIFNSTGFNLIGNNYGATNLNINDFQNEPANLGPLQNNGGPTPTMSLLPGSLAIGTGSSVGAPAIDQRGVPRLAGAYDLGAFQLVTKIIPGVIWHNPTDMVYGTPLGTNQLNATAEMDGLFQYIPAAGTVLSAGIGQTLQVRFVPANTIQFEVVTNAVNINVLKADQSINFGPIADRQVGQPPFALNATASSGLPVTLTLVDGPASIIGNVLSFGTANGLVTVRASQAGNNNFNAAPNVDQSFYIGPSLLPVLTMQPSSLTVNAGDRVVMRVAAEGGAIRYQWQFKGENLPGETQDTLTLGRVTTGFAGPYNVIVGNSAGSVISVVATLLVNVPPGAPRIASQPQSQTLHAGESATLSVGATGGTALGYQWYQGPAGDTNGIIAGATNSVFITPALSTTVSFWVNVMNTSGLADSQPALVTVLQPAAPATLRIDLVPGLTIAGTPGGTYRVDYATLLNTNQWTTLTNLTLFASPFQWADWSSTNSPARFYRAMGQ